MHSTTPSYTVQGKSEEKCSLPDRLDRLRLTLQLNWVEIAQRLELSESMVYQVKSGKKELSDKALWRLRLAEKHAGIAHPVGEAPVRFSEAESLRSGARIAESPPRELDVSALSRAYRESAKIYRAAAAQAISEAERCEQAAEDNDAMAKILNKTVQTQSQSQS